MRTVAYFPIHYGSEYLEYSILSIENHVERILILYSSKPTYGHEGTIKNPDSKHDILEITQKYDCEFVDITHLQISRENEHRKLAFDYAKNEGFDLVLACDYDEVWDNLPEALDYAANGSAYQYGIRGSRWFHFWKSFSEVNKDGFSPVRLFNMHNKPNSEELIEKGTIYHFGYAISKELMQYKISCHGHKSEFPANWLNQKWVNYRKGETTYLHPVTNSYWIETEYFDKTKLPEFMKNHPYYDT